MLHETAHGLACKRFGGTVGSAGFTLLFFMPLAYVDVTSSWRFRSKWQRIATAAAGIYAELFVASIATMVWAASSPGTLQTMALNIALTAGVSTLVFNANPLVRFDGYFILSDLLEMPNLYSCGQQWMADFLQWHVLGRETATPAWPRKKAWIIRVYAVAALAWRVLFFLTFALGLIGTLGHLGMVLAAVLLGFAWGLPVVQTVRRLSRMAAGQADERAARGGIPGPVRCGAGGTRRDAHASRSRCSAGGGRIRPLERRAGLGPRLRRRDSDCQRRCCRAGPADHRAPER